MQISVWEKESFLAPKDVMIIGSGMVGLWSAYYLRKKYPKIKVTILERSFMPSGASTRNAGFACFGSMTELLEDSRKMGEQKMMELVQMRYRGLQKILKLFRKKEIGFERSGGYELIRDASISREELEVQMAWMNKLMGEWIDKKQVFGMADKELTAFGFAGMAYLLNNRLEGSLHSGWLCQALIRLVQTMGVTLLNGMDVTSIEHDGNNVLLKTQLPVELKCSKVLVCTNAFALQLLPGLDLFPARGQVLLTSPVEGLPFKGSFHYDEGYYYFRNLGNRVLLGGARNKAFEEEKTLDMNTSPLIQQELERFLSDHILPGKKYTITDRWSGIMGMGNDKMPVIKQVSPGVYCAVRMNGMGVALAPEAGEKIARIMLDE